MATTSRDVQLRLQIESLGQENITKLVDELRALAAEGGIGAAEFEALATQLDRLGGQSDALQSLKTLTAETDALRAKQEQAATTAAEMAGRLEELRKAVQSAREAQESSRAALTAGEEAYVATGNALRALKAEYSGADRQTEAYTSQLQKLVGEQNEARLALVGLREENRQASAAVTETERALRKGETAAKSAAKQNDSLTEALNRQNKSLVDAGAAAEALGVDVQDLAQAEVTLLTSVNSTLAAADKRKASMQEMAEADRLAAIEAKGLAELYAKGEQALQAEVLALRDAARVTRDYAAAKAQATADAEAWQREAEAVVNLKLAEQQTLQETEKLVASLREAAAVNAFEKQAAEAQKMVQAAQYVRFWETALEEADEAQRQLAANTAKLNDAFSALNIRSVEQVRDEIVQTRAAMDTLAASGRLTGGALAVAMAQGQSKIDELEREIRGLNGTLTTADKLAGLLKNSMGQITAGNLIADGIGYLVNKVKELGAAFVSTIADQEKLRRGLNAVYKDATITAQQMEFLRSAAVSSGVAVAELGPSFLKFAAATQAANIPLEVTNALFLATTRAAGTLGLSGEQVSGMLEALSQMASKGVVSMEELRQQLGDRLPGALSLVAKGLGITEAELIKLVEAGQLAARDLFPALTKGLQSMQGEVTGISATWENFKNVLTGVAQDAGDAGWAEILTGALKVLGGTVGVVALGLSTLWEAMRLVGAGVVALAATLRGEGTQAWGYFNEQVQVSVDRLAKQNDRLSAMLDPTSEAAARMRALAAGQNKAATDTAAATTALEKQAPAVATTAAAVQYLDEVTKVLGNTQMDLGAKVVKISALTAERVGMLEKESVAADKMAKATKVEGDALVTLAQLRGSEIETLRAQQTATENNLAAAVKAADAQRSVTEVLEQQRQALIKLAEQEATGVEGRRAQIEAIDKKLVQSRAETEQTNANVAALTQETAARQLAVQTLADNSARVNEFRQAAVTAEAAVRAYAQALANGSGSQAELTRLQQQAAVATGLYRDALADAAAKVQGLNAVEQAKINLQTAGLSVQQQAYTQLAATSRATGDLVTATYYEIEAKKIQIQITKLTAEAKVKEAQATIAAAEAERAAAEASGTLTEAKKLEIEARILNAKAKQTEAQGSATVVKALEAEIDAIRRGTAAQASSTAATAANTSAISANISERERSIQTREKEIELKEREQALADKARQGSASMSSDIMTRTGIVNFLKQAGVDDEAVARRIANEFADSNGNIQYFNNAGQMKYGGKNSTLSEALLKAAEQYTFSGSRMTAKSSGGATTSETSSAGTTTGRTVTININGKSKTVEMASAADAQNLESVLRQLETSAGTST